MVRVEGARSAAVSRIVQIGPRRVHGHSSGRLAGLRPILRSLSAESNTLRPVIAPRRTPRGQVLARYRAPLRSSSGWRSRRRGMPSAKS